MQHQLIKNATGYTMSNDESNVFELRTYWLPEESADEFRSKYSSCKENENKITEWTYNLFSNANEEDDE